jgi:hypothetical protein
MPTSRKAKEKNERQLKITYVRTKCGRILGIGVGPPCPF